jgi:hypothetical protein
MKGRRISPLNFSEVYDRQSAVTPIFSLRWSKRMKTAGAGCVSSSFVGSCKEVASFLNNVGVPNGGNTDGL